MASTAGDKIVRIVHCDISEDMKLRAIEFTLMQDKAKSTDIAAAETLAKLLKKDFDNRFHPTW